MPAHLGFKFFNDLEKGLLRELQVLAILQQGRRLKVGLLEGVLHGQRSILSCGVFRKEQCKEKSTSSNTLVLLLFSCCMAWLRQINEAMQDLSQCFKLYSESLCLRLFALPRQQRSAGRKAVPTVSKGLRVCQRVSRVPFRPQVELLTVGLRIEKRAPSWYFKSHAESQRDLNACS